MKDERAQYLMVNSNEIEKNLYVMERTFAFNDSFNDYYPIGQQKAEKIFKKNNIPEKFQKIIIKIDLSFLSKYEGQEFILGMPFDLTGRKIEKINKERYLNATTIPLFYDNNRFDNFIEFKTKLKKVSYDEILKFLKELKNEGYLEKYINTLKEFFNINLHIKYEINEDNIIEEIKQYKLKHPYNRGLNIEYK